MNSSDTFLLKFWEVMAGIGFITVIIGVVIEGIEHFKKFPKKEQKRKIQIEKIGWLLVVGGLAIEFFGDQAAKRISDRETARLNNEAGEARKDAARANERAALVESNNLVLRKELQPRTITPSQWKNFVFLTEKIYKAPIKIHIGMDGDDTAQFAINLRAMFDAAKFPRDTTAKEMGITRNPESPTLFWRHIGDSEDSFTLRMCCYSTTNVYFPSPLMLENTNGFFRPIVMENDTQQIYDALYKVLNDIGIKTGWGDTTTFLKPGEYEFFVPLKNN